jgi:histidine phosphotransferase ChpT
MSDLLTVEAKLSDLDLAALLCSRVCHDVISPVGAIANGLELIDDPEMDQETKDTALEMVRSSARTAAAKLKFCRIAFGAAGSAGALIDLGEAGEIAKAFVGDEKVKLLWNAPHENRPKQQVKLVLNMLLMAMAGIPRGGLVTVTVEGDVFSARAAGDRAKVPDAISQVLDGTLEVTGLDARLVQPYYARELARSAGLSLSMGMDGADVVVQAA